MDWKAIAKSREVDTDLQYYVSIGGLTYLRVFTNEVTYDMCKHCCFFEGDYRCLNPRPSDECEDSIYIKETI